MSSNSVHHINIIGYGYVGSAVGHLCKKNGVDFCTYDVMKKSETGALDNFDNLQELVEASEKVNDVNVYFIAVPTPTGENGECNTQIVENVLRQLNGLCSKTTCVLLKSTVAPGTCSRLYDNYIKESAVMQFVYCPEFLREKTFEEDMYNASFVLLGGQENFLQAGSDVMKLLYNHNPNIKIVTKSYEACEMFKYTINVYLSMKVWFFNEINIMCDTLHLDYQNLHELFELEPRIGNSHTQVPGHDGKYGFGGKCLPKETKGMCYLQNQLGLDNSVLERVIQRNKEIRGSED